MHAMDSVCLDCGSPEADWGGISYGSNSVGSFMLRSRVEFNTVMLLLFSQAYCYACTVVEGIAGENSTLFLNPV